MWHNNNGVRARLSVRTALCFLLVLLLVLLGLFLVVAPWWATDLDGEMSGQKKLTENPVRDFLMSQQAPLKLKPASCMELLVMMSKVSIVI